MSVINTNIQAIAAARNLNASQEMLGRSLSRLSSGSKIVNPSDDAAGLAVSEKLDAQGRRVKAAITNVQNAVSYVQTADGFMSGMTKILSRMSELAILAKDVTKNSTDVDLYSQEFTALQDQLRATIGGSSGDIGGTADIGAPLGAFNGIALFGSTTGGGLTVTSGQAVSQEMTILRLPPRINEGKRITHATVHPRSDPRRHRRASSHFTLRSTAARASCPAAVVEEACGKQIAQTAC
jgi:flagellin